MVPALEALAEGFTRQHSNVLVNVGGGGSALGETRARDGRVTFGASTFLVDETGQATATVGSVAGGPAQTRSAPPARPTPLIRIPIGIDGIALIVHSSNPVAGLTMQQVQDIFSGRVLDWAEVGGDGGEVLLISREEGSGTRRAFESRVMGATPVSLTAVVMPTSRDVVEYVAGNPSAVGYVSAAFVATAAMAAAMAADVAVGVAGAGPTGTLSPGAVSASEPVTVRAVAIDGVLPTDAGVNSQEYPLVQLLYLVSLGEPRGWARQFVDFALSPAGQAIVDRYHVRVR